MKQTNITKRTQAHRYREQTGGCQRGGCGEERERCRGLAPNWYKLPLTQLSSLFSHLVVSNSLWPQGLQHAGLPCPSPSPRACSNSCPLSWGGHPPITSSVASSSCPQSFTASGSFLISKEMSHRYEMYIVGICQEL